MGWDQSLYCKFKKSCFKQQMTGIIKIYPRLSLEFYAYKIVSSSSQEMGRLSAKSAFLTIGDFCIE